MPTYSEKLLDPRWQRRRLEILQRDNFTCKVCLDNTSTLHVHHVNYLANTEVWDYSDEYLETLCRSCHDTITKDRAAAEKVIINKLRLSLREPFTINCASSVFNNYKELHHLFYILWELKDNENDVISALVKLYYEVSESSNKPQEITF